MFFGGYDAGFGGVGLDMSYSSEGVLGSSVFIVVGEGAYAVEGMDEGLGDVDGFGFEGGVGGCVGDVDVSPEAEHFGGYFGFETTDEGCCYYHDGDAEGYGGYCDVDDQSSE